MGEFYRFECMSTPLSGNRAPNPLPLLLAAFHVLILVPKLTSDSLTDLIAGKKFMQFLLKLPVDAESIVGQNRLVGDQALKGVRARGGGLDEYWAPNSITRRVAMASYRQRASRY